MSPAASSAKELLRWLKVSGLAMEAFGAGFADGVASLVSLDTTPAAFRRSMWMFRSFFQGDFLKIAGLRKT